MRRIWVLICIEIHSKKSAYNRIILCYKRINDCYNFNSQLFYWNTNITKKSCNSLVTVYEISIEKWWWLCWYMLINIIDRYEAKEIRSKILCQKTVLWTNHYNARETWHSCHNPFWVKLICVLNVLYFTHIVGHLSVVCHINEQNVQFTELSYVIR